MPALLHIFTTIFSNQISFELFDVLNSLGVRGLLPELSIFSLRAVEFTLSASADVTGKPALTDQFWKTVTDT